MYFTQSIFILLAAFAAGAAALPAKRQSVPITVTGTPGSPGTLLAEGQSTPFTPGGWLPGCYPGYTPIDVYMLDSQPTVSSLNSTYGIDDYLYFFGSYLIRNVDGLPSMGTPPPSSLTMPDLGATYSGQPVYLVTVATVSSCVPNGYTKYGINYLEYVYDE